MFCQICESTENNIFVKYGNYVDLKVLRGVLVFLEPECSQELNHIKYVIHIWVETLSMRNTAPEIVHNSVCRYNHLRQWFSNCLYSVPPEKTLSSLSISN